MPQIRSYPQATTLLPTDAFVIDRIGTGTEFIQGLNFIPTTLIWTANCFYEGSGPPTTSQLIGGWSVPVKSSFPDNYADALTIGWGAHAEVAPTSAFNISLALNDVLAATLTLNTDGTFNYTSASGLAWTANVRDRITAVAPAGTDATINGFFFTIAGQLIP